MAPSVLQAVPAQAAGDFGHAVPGHDFGCTPGRSPAAGPLVVLHDVGWPLGRRDTYHAPELVPDEPEARVGDPKASADEPELIADELERPAQAECPHPADARDYQSGTCAACGAILWD